MDPDIDRPPGNRERKLRGRDKRRGYVQGTRTYTHALVNSIARRLAEKGADRRDRRDGGRDLG